MEEGERERGRGGVLAYFLVLVASEQFQGSCLFPFLRE